MPCHGPVVQRVEDGGSTFPEFRTHEASALRRNRNLGGGLEHLLGDDGEDGAQAWLGILHFSMELQPKIEWAARTAFERAARTRKARFA